MALPTLILTPGAWHTSQAYEKIVPRLQAKGYTCDIISLPSIGQTPPVQDMSSDIAAVRDAVTRHADAGEEIVMVVHSWSGAVVNSALDGLSKKERGGRGEPGGVVRLLFTAAFVVPQGVSVFDALGGKVPELWNVDGDVIHANNPVVAFYNDLDPAEAEHYASFLKPHATATKYTKTTGAAWKDIPSVYLLCEDDQAMPLFAQEAMVKGAQAAGADMKVERIKASHSPFLSKPEEFVDFVDRHTKHE